MTNGRRTKSNGDDTGQMLTGMRQICSHTGLSEATILDLIMSSEFPARKTKGGDGIWISNRASIDRWSEEFSESKY